MSNPKSPYDPQPERGDAFGEQARQGFEQVPGDHAAALSRLRSRLQVPVEAPATEATVRQLSPKPAGTRRWLVAVAGIAAMLIAGLIIWNYQGEQDQFAANTQNSNKASENIEVSGSVLEAEDVTAAKDAVSKVSATPTEETALRLGNEETGSFDRVASKQQVDPPVVVSSPSGAKIRSETISSGMEGVEVNDIPVTKPVSPAKIAQLADALTDQEESTLQRLQDEAKAGEARKKREPAALNAIPAISKSEASVADEPELTEGNSSTDEARDTVFYLERASKQEVVRTVTGTIRNQLGAAISDAVIVIEETGQQFRSNQYGGFELELYEGARVAVISNGRSDVLRFDITDGNQYEVMLSDEAHALSRVTIYGRTASIQLIPERAMTFEAFERFLDTKQGKQREREVVLQFMVNRFGRPKTILAGPGEVDREDLKQAKQLLQEGPDWPEQYRKQGWRYTVRL